MDGDSTPSGEAGEGASRRGGGIAKLVLWALVIAICVVVLFTWVFPWIESLQQDPTIASLQVLLAPR